jgi:serine protease inhibitor
MSYYTKRDTERLNSSILQLSLHGNPELTLSISNRSIPHNLSALWHLGMKSHDPIIIDDDDDDIPMHIDDTVIHHPPVPRWYVSRQNHCIHAILNYLPPNENVVLSPFSLISCMAMLCRGATLGPARDQLAHYCWPSAADATVCDDSVALPALAAFVSQLANVKVCRYANILMTDHANVQEYKNDILEHFKANPYALEDYGEVNREVLKITTIPKPVLPRKPDATVLINAVYFADQWVYEFDTELTPKPFMQPSGLSVRVDMMHQKNRFSIAQFDSTTAVHLPYKTPGLGAWFVKHNLTHTHEAAYKALQKFLDHEFFKHTLPTSTKHVDLTVPKFTMNSSIDLRTLFYQTTGHKITHVFQLQGHLARMSTDENEFVSRFDQECILEVDQKGTVAAAVTTSGATRSPGGGGPSYEYVSFQHTFYMVIHHNDTILFVAKVASPTPSKSPSQTPSQAPSHKVVQTSKESTKYNPWEDLEHNLIIPFLHGDFLLITKEHDGKDDKEGEFIESFMDTDKEGNIIKYTNKEGQIIIKDTQKQVYKRTYTVPLDLLLRVQMAFRNKKKETPDKPDENPAEIFILPVYINGEGGEEPEDLMEVSQTPREIRFPLQKEKGEDEDGWDLKDQDGKTFFKIRFTLDTLY